MVSDRCLGKEECDDAYLNQSQRAIWSEIAVFTGTLESQSNYRLVTVLAAVQARFSKDRSDGSRTRAKTAALTQNSWRSFSRFSPWPSWSMSLRTLQRRA
jgi:hypothetical protein